MEENTITIEQFINENGITAEFKNLGPQTEMVKNDKGKKEPHTMDAWQVTLTRAGQTMNTSFKTGLGLRAVNRQKLGRALGSYPNKQEMEQAKYKHIGSTKWLLDYCDPVTPKAQDILDSLASDASAYDNARNFEDFCSDFGYDEDSRTAEGIYKACGELAKELKYFLGADLYETLLYKAERL